MLGKQAKDAARQWVAEQAGSMPGFLGAYIAGSANWAQDNALFTSDIDINVVLESNAPQLEQWHVVYRDVLLDISSISRDSLGSADSILGTYYLAGHFAHQSVLADPLGILGQLQAEVSRAYPQRRWVRTRLEGAMTLARSTPSWVDESQPFAMRVVLWWLGSLMYGLYSLHVADLRNPTFSRNLVVSREVLTKYGRLPLLEDVLETIGISRMSRAQATAALEKFAAAFDCAAEVMKTPFMLSWSINPSSRSFMVDRYLAWVETDDYREIMFQPLIYLSLCQLAIQNDAPEAIRQRFAADYMTVLEQLGVTSENDLLQRKDQTRQLLYAIGEAAEAIVDANPAITE